MNLPDQRPRSILFDWTAHVSLWRDPSRQVRRVNAELEPPSQDIDLDDHGLGNFAYRWRVRARAACEGISRESWAAGDQKITEDGLVDDLPAAHAVWLAGGSVGDVDVTIEACIELIDSRSHQAYAAWLRGAVRLPGDQEGPVSVELEAVAPFESVPFASASHRTASVTRGPAIPGTNAGLCSLPGVGIADVEWNAGDGSTPATVRRTIVLRTLDGVRSLLPPPHDPRPMDLEWNSVTAGPQGEIAAIWTVGGPLGSSDGEHRYLQIQSARRDRPPVTVERTTSARIMPWEGLFDPSGRVYLFAVDYDRLGALDLDTRTVTWTAPLPGTLEETGLFADAHRVYLVGDNDLETLDLVTGGRVDCASVDSGPYGACRSFHPTPHRVAWACEFLRLDGAATCVGWHDVGGANGFALIDEADNRELTSAVLEDGRILVVGGNVWLITPGEMPRIERLGEAGLYGRRLLVTRAGTRFRLWSSACGAPWYLEFD